MRRRQDEDKVDLFGYNHGYVVPKWVRLAISPGTRAEPAD